MHDFRRKKRSSPHVSDDVIKAAAAAAAAAAKEGSSRVMTSHTDKRRSFAGIASFKQLSTKGKRTVAGELWVVTS